MENNLKVEDILYRVSRPDIRDYIYEPSGQELRPAVDLREWAGLIEDQAYLGSCSGNATVSAYELMVKRLYPDYWTNLSRLFVYYNARIYESTVDEDSGATIRNTMKGLAKYGVCKETLWPYNISKYAIVPSTEAYAEALHRKITKYQRMTSIEHILDAINTYYPVVSGVLIYESFLELNSQDPVMAQKSSTDYIAGGHAITIIGYDLGTEQFLVENSFGPTWGMGGYCYMPFEYARQNLLENWIFDIPNQETTLTT